MADVASDFKDWSTTASSNAPTDATSIGGGLADNLQQIQATVRAALASKGSDIASASTTNLIGTVGAYHDITGTTTITSFGTGSVGIRKVLQFDGALTLTHNATSLILPGGANITTAAGDRLEAICEGSGNWRVLWYTKATGGPVTVNTADIAAKAVTLAKMADGTQGGTLYYGASGVIAELAAGTSGYLLKTQGAGANPAWASFLSLWRTLNTPVALTDAVTIAVDLDTGLNFTVTLGGNRTLGNPTNQNIGQSGYIKVTQDGTGSRTLAFDTHYVFAYGTDPILSTAAAAIDVLYYQVTGTNQVLISKVPSVA